MVTQFTDAEFMEASEKALVLKQWRSFLKRLAVADLEPLQGADYGYFPASLERAFPDRLYKHLSLHCSFIAHYNRLGFISARFTNDQDIASSFLTIRERGAWGEYRDIGQAMIEVLDEMAPLFEKRWARARANAESAERNELARLQAKYQA